jgi:hypothetical protein
MNQNARIGAAKPLHYQRLLVMLRGYFFSGQKGTSPSHSGQALGVAAKSSGGSIKNTTHVPFTS